MFGEQFGGGQLVANSAEGFAEAGNCDWSQTSPGPLPGVAITDVLGVVRGDHQRFRQWFRAMERQRVGA